VPRKRIMLEPGEMQELTRRIRSSTVSVRDRQRAEIILLAAEGRSQEAVGQAVGVTRVTVNHWCRRFAQSRLAGLSDAPGRGRKSVLPVAAIRKVIEAAGQPPARRSRWSCRSMAQATGISAASVQRLWAANDIKPHLLHTFKLSNDTRFQEKFWDVIGLYLNPPEKAIILCCDEKSQCQALERTQPGLPLGIGHVKTMSHDYIRHGTLTLFAALNYLEGNLITTIAEQHRHQEWLAFLKKIDRETPKGLTIHLIADNYATHKHVEVKAWLAKHPRFHMHFTPTSSSWLNLVERFFRDVTERIRDCSFASVRELADTIIAFLAERNQNPKRYVWKAKGEDILRKIERARHVVARQDTVVMT
jgi:transposase